MDIKDLSIQKLAADYCSRIWGEPDTWTTDHAKHLMAFKEIEHKPLNINDFFSKNYMRLIELEGEIQASNLDSEAKADTLKLIENQMTRELSNNCENARKRPVGRPSKTHVHEFMDYLHGQLGSYKKAAEYIIEAAYIGYDSSPDSLIRENQKYRNGAGK